MRILFILEYYYPHIGGVETFFKTLIEKLDTEGHEVTVFTNRYDTKLPAQESMGKNISIIRKRYYNRYLFTFFAWWSALRYARKSDLIHTTSYNAAIPAWIAAKCTGIKSIITFHERWGKLWYQLPWMSYPAKVLHFSFEWLITKLSFDRYVGVSEYTKNSLLSSGISKQRVERIYNGINYEGWPEHQGSGRDQPYTFLYFGRVGHAKGMDVLLKAYQQLLEKRKDHQLTLVVPSENTSLLRKIKKLIVAYKLESHITIKHDLPYKDLLSEIAHADAVVIPSYSEGFCFAAVETMAIGTPIISSGQGALSEVVSGQHIETVSLDTSDMMTAMQEALEGQWIETELIRFQLSDTISAYQQLYKEIL